KQGFTYFFLTHDGTVGVNESGMEIRPYCFYPNPVQAQLQMQFSPDVKPKQVELYDLQGRLVRMQSSGFESVDMSRLPAGAYMLRVTLEDEKVFSDKVVKE
ncbi:MAG: T9SS type A sorting domain-containing protein, partial [Bacteroidales bacterium]|nr:T9SS type A sorting domain-containing protein [Bacteroidales bacterium]